MPVSNKGDSSLSTQLNSPSLRGRGVCVSRRGRGKSCLLYILSYFLVSSSTLTANFLSNKITYNQQNQIQLTNLNNTALDCQLTLSTTTLTLKIIDNHNKPIPYVIVQTEHHTQIADKNGIVKINYETNQINQNQKQNQERTAPDCQLSTINYQLTFSRIGYHSLTKTIDELLENPIVKMQIASLENDEMRVKGERATSTFRLTSPTRRIEVGDLQKQYTSVDELLRDITQIEVRGVRLAGERQTISLGGHQSRHTIVMLDNIVLNPAGQEVDLSTIPASQIESVEIVKNNTSVESGSGGIGGMIILHTKQQARNEVHTSGSIGSFGSHTESAGFSAYANGFTLGMNFTHQYADNDFEYTYQGETKRRAHNSKRIYNLSTNTSYHTENHKFSYNLRYQSFHKELPGSVNYAELFKGAYQKGQTTQLNLSLSGSVAAFSNRHPTTMTTPSPLQYDLSAHLTQNNSLYDNTKAPIPFYHMKDKTLHTISGAKVGLRQPFPLSRSAQLLVNLGSEYRSETFEVKDKLTGRNDIPQISSETTSLLGGLTLKSDIYDGLAEAEVIVSGRADNVTRQGKHNSYRGELNLSFDTPIPFAIKSSLGTSYMIPSFYELYWKGDNQTSGNPDLLPEESFGYRIEISTDTNPSLSIARWQNKTDNMIFWNRTNQGWKPFNLSTASINNWELSGDYRFLDRQSLSVNYTRTTAKDKTPDSGFYDKNIIYTPSYIFNAKLNMKVAIKTQTPDHRPPTTEHRPPNTDLSQTITYNATGKQYITRDNMIPPLSGYETWNSTTGLHYSIGIFTSKLTYSLYNVFDRRYEVYDYMPEVGRHWEVFLDIGIRN